MNLQGILSLFPDSRVLKSGDGLRAASETKDAFWLKAGDTFEGEVIRLLPENRVMLSAGDKALTARTNIPLSVGERIEVMVQRTDQEVLLKVLNRFPSLKTVVAREIKPLLGAFHRPVDEIFTNLKGLIKSVLTGGSLPENSDVVPLLSKLDDLLNNLNINARGAEEGAGPSAPAGREGDIPAQGFLNNAPAPANFLKWLEDSGLKWENKLRQLVEAPPEDVASALKSLVEHDLKGLTEKIIDMLSAEVEKPAVDTQQATMGKGSLVEKSGGAKPASEGPARAAPEGSGPAPDVAAPPIQAPLGQLVQHLAHLSQTIRLHQWLNGVHDEPLQNFYFQVPVALSDGLKTVEMFVQKKRGRNARERDQKKETPDEFWVVFFLTLSALGTLRIDLKTRRKVLSLAIKTETPTAAHLMEPLLPRVKASLGAIGYQVSGVSVAHSPTGQVTKPDPADYIPAMAHGMVSIVV